MNDKSPKKKAASVQLLVAYVTQRTVPCRLGYSYPNALTYGSSFSRWGSRYFW